MSGTRLCTGDLLAEFLPVSCGGHLLDPPTTITATTKSTTITIITNAYA